MLEHDLAREFLLVAHDVTVEAPLRQEVVDDLLQSLGVLTGGVEQVGLLFGLEDRLLALH
mgnify:CR=1 FL=1